MSRIENAFVWVYAIADLLKRFYLKAFPFTALVVGAVCVIGWVGTDELGMFRPEYLDKITTVALIYTLAALLYTVLELREARKK